MVLDRIPEAVAHVLPGELPQAHGLDEGLAGVAQAHGERREEDDALHGHENQGRVPRHAHLNAALHLRLRARHLL